MRNELCILFALTLPVMTWAAPKDETPKAVIQKTECFQEQIDRAGLVTHKIFVKNLTDKPLARCWGNFVSSQWTSYDSKRFDSCKITPTETPNLYQVELRHKFKAPTATATYSIESLSVAPENALASHIFNKPNESCEVQVIGEKNLETLEILSFSAEKAYSGFGANQEIGLKLVTVIKSPTPLDQIFVDYSYDTTTSKGHYTAAAIIDSTSDLDTQVERNGNTFTYSRTIPLSKLGWSTTSPVTKVYVGRGIKALDRAQQISKIGNKYYQSFDF